MSGRSSQNLLDLALGRAEYLDLAFLVRTLSFSNRNTRSGHTNLVSVRSVLVFRSSYRP